MKHSLARHKALYATLNKLGAMEDRHELVYSFTEGRTSDTKELSDSEVDGILSQLTGKRPQTHIDRLSEAGYQYSHRSRVAPEGRFAEGHQSRRRILSLCYQIGWTVYDPGKGKMVVDMARLNNWCVQYGHMHQPLMDYRPHELGKLVTQFEHFTYDILK
jgi:hypothetical protein